MNIIKVNVINFGKLSNKEISFKAGLNSFLRENGFGKTTLTVFIKSMFYGMDYTTSKDVEKNERAKYMPWQGGIYGGSLTFENKGKEYTISRTFGKKKAEDTFELFDCKTNKISTDFSEDIGNELFGINRESYGRSVYVTLSDSPMGSADISAKLNSLVDANDVSNFDNVCEKLKKKTLELQSTKKNIGLLPQIQQKIDDNLDYLEIIKAKINQNIECENRISGIKKEIVELEKKRDSVSEEMSFGAKYESKLRYEELKKYLSEEQKKKNEIENFFNGIIPTEETLKTINSILQSYTVVDSNIANQGITQSEADDYEQLKSFFNGDIPSQEQISDCLKTDKEYSEFKQIENSKKMSAEEKTELEKYKKLFENSDISEEKITQFIDDVGMVKQWKSESVAKKAESDAKKQELEAAQNEKTGSFKKVIFGVLAGIFLVAGIVGFIIKILPLEVGGFIFTAIFALLAIVLKGKKQDFSELENQITKIKSESEQLLAKANQKESVYKNFISKYMGENNQPENVNEIIVLTNISKNFSNYLRLATKEKEYYDWLKNQKMQPQEYESKLLSFINHYCKSDNILNVSYEINILNGKLNKLKNLEERINADSKNAKIQGETKTKLMEILNQFKTDKTLSLSEQVQQIHNKLADLRNIEESIQISEKRIVEFEQNPDINLEDLNKIHKPKKSVDELKNELDVIEIQIKEKTEAISHDQKTVDNNQADTDKKDDVESEIDRLTVEKREKEQEYSILTKTMNFLFKAKENLDANYSGPMKQSFTKYIQDLGSSLNLVINTDLQVLIDENGKHYESVYLSEGYKDMVNFCARMALVDSLFKDVKPPVILDDPFVNLDDNKIPQAMELVKNLSKEKQILYFTCHDSRNL